MIAPRRSRELRVLFAGGGSGGHLFPGLAVAEELASRPGGESVRCRFLATTRAVDRQILGSRGVDWRPLPGLRDGGARRLGALGRAPGSLAAAFAEVRRFRPHVVVGLGGFGSLPAGAVAGALGLPLYLIEPNVLPGRANRLLAARARETWLQFEDAAERLPARARTAVVGTPLRRSLRPVARQDARRRLDLSPGATVLLVVGGSQGADVLNREMPASSAALAARCRSLEVLHLAGDEAAAAEVARAYAAAGVRAHVSGFLEAMGDAYSAADVVVARAGAGTASEALAMRCAAVLVPYPHADAHQRDNARWVASRGAAVCVEESDWAGVVAATGSLLAEPATRAAMGERARNLGRPDAARRAVDRMEHWGDLERRP